MLLILVLLLLLFGADKAPQLARSIGRARASFERARGELADSIRSDDERAWEAQRAFEEARERKVAEVGAAAPAPAAERDRLERAARELGLQTQGLDDADLRAAIRAKLEG